MKKKTITINAILFFGMVLSAIIFAMVIILLGKDKDIPFYYMQIWLGVALLFGLIQMYYERNQKWWNKWLFIKVI